MNQFDKFFKSEFEHHELNPPKDAWEAIASKLEAKRPAPLMFYLKRAAAVAAVLMIGFFVYDANFGSHTQSQTSAPEFNQGNQQTVLDEQGTAQSGKEPIATDSPSESEEGLAGTAGTNSNSDGTLEAQEVPFRGIFSGRDAADIERNKGSLNNRRTQTISNQSLARKEVGNAQEGWFYPNLNDISSPSNRNAKSNSSENNPRIIERKNTIWDLDAGNLAQQDVRQGKSANGTSGLGEDFAAGVQGLGLDFFSPDALYPVFPTELPDDLSLDIYQEWAKNQDSDKEEEKKETLRKMDVYAYASPTRFDALAGNLLPELQGLEQEASTSVAYGFRAGYALSKRWKIRSGVAMMEVNQTTRDVPLTNTALNAGIQLFSAPTIPIRSINYTSTVQMNTGPDNSAVGEINTRAVNNFKGDLNQNIAYVEIPLEVEYKVIQKNKLGISATAGASTFLLTNNEITADTQGERLVVGEANNLNGTSVSANLGVRFDVNVRKNVDFTVEPHFKYLMNSVNNNPDFQPYVTGVNAGIRIKL